MRKDSIQRQHEVLKVLRRHGQPMTAYEILGELKNDETALAPPTVYRALSALVDSGRAHRLESLNAFVPCQCAHNNGLPILAICDDCGRVEEHVNKALMGRLAAITRGSGFRAQRHVVELHGICGSCSS